MATASLVVNRSSGPVSCFFPTARPVQNITSKSVVARHAFKPKRPARSTFVQNEDVSHQGNMKKPLPITGHFPNGSRDAYLTCASASVGFSHLIDLQHAEAQSLMPLSDGADDAAVRAFTYR
jgi:hypothetical protein